jgi:hypothetical protein
MDQVKEGCTARITMTFVDETGVAVTSLDAITLTLYEKESEAIINSKNATDISSSFSAGTLALTLSPTDNAMTTTNPSEIHVALIEYTYGTSKKGKWPVVFEVIDIPKAH